MESVVISPAIVLLRHVSAAGSGLVRYFAGRTVLSRHAIGRRIPQGTTCRDLTHDSTSAVARRREVGGRRVFLSKSIDASHGANPAGEAVIFVAEPLPRSVQQPECSLPPERPTRGDHPQNDCYRERGRCLKTGVTTDTGKEALWAHEHGENMRQS